MDNQEINSVAETISQEIHTSPMVLESKKSYKLIFTIVGVLILFILITGWVFIYLTSGNKATSLSGEIELNSAPPQETNTLSGTWSNWKVGSWVESNKNSIPEKESIKKESSIPKVFKIKSYTKNENNSYEYISYWSAISIGGGRILTNAHVVLDENDIPTGNYNLCVPKNDSEAPECVGALELVKYDKTNDIALLFLLKDSTDLWQPVDTTEKELSMGETVKIYGYPSNGGSTLSLTEWKMSGMEKLHYKVDANIDNGNSGWGAFDKDNKFIWMPYVARVWLTTMGYIIPNKMINEFLLEEWDITRYDTYDKNFENYISAINKTVQEQKIVNPFFSFDWFQRGWFKLVSVSGDIESGYSKYEFTTVSENTRITISVPHVTGKARVPYIADILKLKDNFENFEVLDATQTGWKLVLKQIRAEWLKKQNGNIDANYALYFYTTQWVNYSIVTKSKRWEKKKVENAIRLFLENLQVTWNTTNSVWDDFVEVYSGSISLPDSVYAQESCEGKCSYAFVLNENNSIILDINEKRFSDNHWATLATVRDASQSIMEKLRQGNTSTAEIKTNKKWINYIFSKTKWSDGSQEIIATFISSNDPKNLVIYRFSITIEAWNEYLESAFEQVIDWFSSNLYSIP
jgi:S1-C subfamily serine protease